MSSYSLEELRKIRKTYEAGQTSAARLEVYLVADQLIVSRTNKRLRLSPETENEFECRLTRLLDRVER